MSKLQTHGRPPGITSRKILERIAWAEDHGCLCGNCRHFRWPHFCIKYLSEKIDPDRTAAENSCSLWHKNLRDYAF